MSHIATIDPDRDEEADLQECDSVPGTACLVVIGSCV